MQTGMSLFSDTMSYWKSESENQLRQKNIPIPSQPSSEYEYIKNRVDVYNAVTGNLEGYDCPVCKNKGTVSAICKSEDGEVFEGLSQCKCMKIRFNAKRLEKSGLAEFVNEKTFDNYQAVEQWQIHSKSKVMNFAENPQGWLYCGGQSGAGKTHLCTATCLSLIDKGYSVKYLLWTDLLQKFQATKYKAELRELYIKDNFTDNDVIYIDDFLKRYEKEDITIAFAIINQLIVLKKTVIISSELLYEDLKGTDEALAGRIVEKSKGQFVQIIRNPTRNYRLKNI